MNIPKRIKDLSNVELLRKAFHMTEVNAYEYAHKGKVPKADFREECLLKAECCCRFLSNVGEENVDDIMTYCM